MSNKTRGNIIKGIAIFIDVLVPLAATLTQFPVWVQHSSEATVSGLFMVFAFLACLPFLRQLKEYFKSPSVWVIWTIFFVFFVLLKNIINEMIMVCFFGAVANVVGAIIYSVGKRVADKPDKSCERSKS